MSDERESWNSVAGAWRKHRTLLEAATGELNRRLIDRAGIREGHSILDVATGTGEPALTAARRVGARGRVTATDFSAGMLAEARERAAEVGLTNLEFVERDAQSLGFDSAGFDAAICRWGLMLIPDPRAALSGVLRSLAPGGRFAAVVWGPPDRVPFLTLPRAVVASRLGLPPPPGPGLDTSPHPLRMAKPGMLEELFREAGFDDVGSESIAVDFRFPSSAEYVEMIRDMSSSLRDTLAEHPERTRERVWSAIAAEADKYRNDRGQVVLTSLAPCVWGSKSDRA